MDERLVTRDSSVPPSVLIAAIANETREWRESFIPDALHAEGVFRVVGRIDGMSFVWSFFGGEPKGGSVRLRGEVLSTSSGSVVRARVVRASKVWPIGVLFAAVGILNLVTRDISSALFLFGAAAIPILINWAQEGTIPNWTRSRAEYLVERLSHAINEAEALRHSQAPVP